MNAEFTGEDKTQIEDEQYQAALRIIENHKARASQYTRTVDRTKEELDEEKRVARNFDRTVITWVVIVVVGICFALMYGQRLNQSTKKLTDSEYKATAAKTEKQIEWEQHLARKAVLDAEPYAKSAEIVVQKSDDNYGIEPYFVLSDSYGQNVAVTGKVRYRLTVKDNANDTESDVYDQTVDVQASDFATGTRGLGSFKRDAVLYTFGKVSTENLSGEQGTIYFTFTSHRGDVLKAKDFVSYP